MGRTRLIAILLLIGAILVGLFSFTPESSHPGFLKNAFPIQLGLDLSGGTQLTYSADTSKLDPSEVNESMAALRNVIERRVNLFGVSQPIVQTEQGSVVAGNGSKHRLIVQLPGVTDVKKAEALIGKTPVLDFRLLKKDAKGSPAVSPQSVKVETSAGTTTATTTSTTSATSTATSTAKYSQYIRTAITGRYLTGASLQFNQTTGEPIVALNFNSKGAEMFAKLTKDNVGRVLAIFLDGSPISTPVIQQEITGGDAVISGNFTPKEARTLVDRLNAGALPVPIHLLSSQTVGATLGNSAFQAGILAGIIAFFVVAFFMILWYRLPGLVAIVALGAYAAINVAFYRLIPVTLTAAGIAGFILSVGMAVDANILIFERMKEELRKGKSLFESTHDGFKRAWPSIRDSHVSSIITAIVLYWLGTSVVKGFALVFGIGVIVSLFSAVTLTRIFLFSLGISEKTNIHHFFFGSGFPIFRKKQKESDT